MLEIAPSSSSLAMAVTGCPANGGAGPGLTSQVERGVVVHEGQPDELGEPRCAAAPRKVRKCRIQCKGVSTWPYIIVELEGRPTSWAVVTTSIHSEAGSFPLRQDPAHIVVQDLGSGTRDGVHPSVAQALQELPDSGHSGSHR